MNKKFMILTLRLLIFILGFLMEDRIRSTLVNHKHQSEYELINKADKFISKLEKDEI